MNVDWGWGSPVLSNKIIWLVVKQFVVLWILEFFLDDGDNFVMIHVTNVIIVDSWFGRPFMKRYFDGNCSLGPAGALKELFGAQFVCSSSQLCINGIPVCATDVFWSKFRGPNDLYKLLKTFLRLLDSAIPIPVTKEKE